MFKPLALAIYISSVIVLLKPTTNTIFAFMRHGARAPFTPVTDYYRSIGANEPYDLTVFGIMEHVQLGEYIATQYGRLNTKDTVFYSDDVSRCITSMEAFAYGYYDDTSEPDSKVLENSFFKPVDYSDFNNEQMNEVSIEASFINRKYIRALKYGLESAIKTHCPVCTVPNSHYDKLKLMKDMYSLYYCNSMNLAPVDYFTAELVSVLETMQLKLYDIEFLQYQYAVTSSYNIFQLIRKFLSAETGKTNSRSVAGADDGLEVAKGTFVFGHDHNIMAILVVLLGRYEVYKSVRVLPEFAASVVIETFSDSSAERPVLSRDADTDEVYVKVMYRFKELKLDFCKKRNCTIKEFVGFIDQLRPSL